MKKLMPIILIGLVSVPAVFNSCQGGFKAQKSVNSSPSRQSCKVTLEKGGLQKIRQSYDETPQVFLTGKVQLGSDDGNGGLSKATANSEIVASGSKISAIFDNACLKTQGPSVNKGISQLFKEEQKQPLEELIRQAYAITLVRDYTVQELNALADEDPCLVGLSWDLIYKPQSVSFNDTEVSQQKHWSSIQSMDAYTSYYGNSEPGVAGKNVRVAVVDTGVDWQHPDLQSNFWTHSQGWGVDATTIAGGTVNYNPFDVSSNGHGTHIAGIIAGVSNNSQGIVGTMPYRAKIMAIKVFKPNGSSIETSTTHLYNGLQFAILNGAEVINLSLQSEGSTYDAVTKASVDDALSRGIIMIVAMGNGSPGALVNGTALKILPAVYSTRQGVMAVGSFDAATRTKSSFSHYSTTYGEIAAPGADSSTSGIFSTLPVALGSYGRLKGTSQATAVVSGAAAMVISAIKAGYGNAPSPAEVERLILDSAYKNSSQASYFKDGNQLDLKRLVSLLHDEYPKTVNLADDSNPNPDPCD